MDITTPIVVDAGADTNPGLIGFENSGSGALTIRGNVNFENLSNNGVTFGLANTGTGSILFSGTLTNSGSNGIGNVNADGTVEFNGNVGSSQLVAASDGTYLLDTGTGYSGLVAYGMILTNGAITVPATTSSGNNLNQFSRYGGGFGGATADESHFEANIANYNGQQTLSAVNGGRVDFDGQLQNGGVGTDPSTGADCQITGTGIIAFTYANGNGYADRYQGSNGTQVSGSNSDVGTEIEGGATLLLTNTSGSATGGGANQGQASDGSGPVGLNNVVQLDAGAALGGTGYTQQQVVAMGATSVITPGDMTKATSSSPYVSRIGTLHLDNGLTAINGLTVNFDLNGTSANDMIEVSNTAQNGIVANGSTVTPLTLRGNVTFNFDNIGGALSGNYVLFTSLAGTSWDVSTANYIVNGPTGYTASTPFVVTINGMEDLDVTFTADTVPEPSTWALLGLGSLALLGTGKFRRQRA